MPARTSAPVRDIDLDPESGALLELLVGEKKHTVLGRGRRACSGIGSYAVVVAADYRRRPSPAGSGTTRLGWRHG